MLSKLLRALGCGGGVNKEKVKKRAYYHLCMAKINI